MKLVRSDEIFCFLRNDTIFRRQQFRADRRVEYIQKDTIQQDSRKKLGKKFEEGFYKPGATLVQAAPVEAEPTISVSALLELLKDADPSVKAQLRLALLT